MRRIMKLATVSAMSAALIGGGASAALAHDNYDIDYTEVRPNVQCVSAQEATGAGLLLGLGLNLNLLNSYSCSASNVNIED